MASERDQLREELNLERARARAWNGLADDSLQFLLRAMSDASAALADPSTLVPWTPADGVPARLESLSNEQRVRFPPACCAASCVWLNLHSQVRVLKFFIAKLSMFIEERASVDSASFLGDVPLGKVPQMQTLFNYSQLSSSQSLPILSSSRSFQATSSPPSPSCVGRRPRE
jgi:hypothetical protein